jgi:ATP-dependent Clp endopeptidase proteolytic subunit ClpP
VADHTPAAPRPARLFQPIAGAERPPGPGYDIKALAGSGAGAEIWLYDEIGGWYGVQVADFVRDLMAIDATAIDLHIHSPGGSAYDGMAIYQALRNHKARITVYVDGLAASAAGFIALAGDRRIIAPHATVMVHDPWGLCIGDASDMDKARAELDKLADNMAALYARRSGGEVGDWREAMRQESWYSAEEAVAAGLMHEVQADAEKTGGDERVQARWDLGAVFAYAGRDAAPPPRIPRAARASTPAAPAPTKTPAAEPDQPTTEEDMVSTLHAAVRQWLGLADDPDDAAIAAAVQARQTDHDTLAAKVAELEAAKAAAEADLADKEQTSAQLAEKVAQLDGLVKEQGEALARINEANAAATKAAVLDAAMQAGKYRPADRDAWAARYDKAPEVTTEVLASIPANSAVPAAPVGHTGPAEPATDDEFDRLVAALDGPTRTEA